MDEGLDEISGAIDRLTRAAGDMNSEVRDVGSIPIINTLPTRSVLTIVASYYYLYHHNKRTTNSLRCINPLAGCHFIESYHQFLSLSFSPPSYSPLPPPLISSSPLPPLLPDTPPAVQDREHRPPHATRGRKAGSRQREAKESRQELLRSVPPFSWTMSKTLLLRSQLNAKISLCFKRDFENDHSKLRILVDSRLENHRLWRFVLTSTTNTTCVSAFFLSVTTTHLITPSP